MRLPQRNEVHVELFPVETDQARLDALYQTLSEYQQQRADRFHFPHSRISFVTAHGVARERLANYLGMEPAEIAYEYGAFGKPSLVQQPHANGRLEFNISHSGTWVAFACSIDRRVGIDIEQIRDMDRLQALARRTFSPQEAGEIENFPEGTRQHEAFFTCWTRNEASVKVFGMGLTMDLDKFNVSVVPGTNYETRLIADHKSEHLEWTLKALAAPDEYVAAVALEGHQQFACVDIGR